MLRKKKPIPTMCSDCARNRGFQCDSITEPSYILKVRNGNCWAKVTPAEAVKIEDDIKHGGKQCH